MLFFLGSFAIGILLCLAVYFSVHIVKLAGLFFENIPKFVKIIIFIAYVLLIPGSLYASELGILWLERFSFGFLLTSLYSIIGFVLYDILHLLAFFIKGKLYAFYQKNPFKKAANCVILCVSLIIVIYGGIHVNQIQVKTYTALVYKDAEGPLHAVMVSDIHMGASIGKALVKRMVDRINALEPDIVFIAGDVFNNNIDNLADPEEVSALLSSIKSKYGVYACLGNHDVDSRLFDTVTGRREPKYDRIAEFLEKSGVTLLDDEAVLVDGRFYVAGRKEERLIGAGQSRMPLDELLEGIDEDKPVFLLDHRPEAVEEAAGMNVDLVMSGHTHNGQVFPGNVVIALTEEYGHGYYKKDRTNVVVSSGIGYWGPAFRIGSDSEIVKIEIEFERSLNE